jgi:hypothetical protein
MGNDSSGSAQRQLSSTFTNTSVVSEELSDDQSNFADLLGESLWVPRVAELPAEVKPIPRQRPRRER